MGHIRHRRAMLKRLYRPGDTSTCIVQVLLSNSVGIVFDLDVVNRRCPSRGISYSFQNMEVVSSSGLIQLKVCTRVVVAHGRLASCPRLLPYWSGLARPQHPLPTTTYPDQHWSTSAFSESLRSSPTAESGVPLRTFQSFQAFR